MGLVEGVIKENRWALPVFELAAVAATFLLGGIWWGAGFVVFSLLLLCIALGKSLLVATRALADVQNALPDAHGTLALEEESHAVTQGEAVSILMPEADTGSKDFPPANTDADDAEDETDVFFDAFRAAANHDLVLTRVLAAKVREERNADDPDDGRAIELSLLAMAGEVTAIPSLRQLADNAPANPSVVNTFISALWNLGERLSAVDEVIARASALETEHQGRLYVRLAGFYLELLDADRAKEIALLAFEMVQDAAFKAESLRQLAEAYVLLRRPLAAISCLEQAISFEPSNSGLQFRVAYLYTERGLQEGSVVHYEEALRLGISPWSQNNLGVAFAGLGLHHLASRAYALAVEGGNSLAAANMAIRLIEAGASVDAQAWLDRAKILTEPTDVQVFERQSQLQNAIKSDEEKLKWVRQGGDVARRFFSEAATAWPTPLPSGRWITPAGVVDLAVASDGSASVGRANDLHIVITQADPFLAISVIRGGTTAPGFAVGDKSKLSVLIRGFPEPERQQVVEFRLASTEPA